ncbi:CAM snf1 domain-containing protein [Cyclospora cayetanensis]|uniref:CAM snf1 domain-containing protein n=1 Tax=Cyclospora cayetanensis TaxID=88456 RepID=A0A1D3D555_9EIME|nr:CAM snf1 domain-containing protein [Cyclospora cayetanensis]
MKMRCGSPGYVGKVMLGLPPEILQDLPYGPKVDVFSSGVILYTLLAGFPPFRGQNVKDILKKNLRCQLNFAHQRWAGIGHSAKDLIGWMCCKQPTKRCAAVQALTHPWFYRISRPLAQKETQPRTANAALPTGDGGANLAEGSSDRLEAQSRTESLLQQCAERELLSVCAARDSPLPKRDIQRLDEALRGLRLEPLRGGNSQADNTNDSYFSSAPPGAPGGALVSSEGHNKGQADFALGFGEPPHACRREETPPNHTAGHTTNSPAAKAAAMGGAIQTAAAASVPAALRAGGEEDATTKQSTPPTGQPLWTAQEHAEEENSEDLMTARALAVSSDACADAAVVAVAAARATADVLAAAAQWALQQQQQSSAVSFCGAEVLSAAASGEGGAPVVLRASRAPRPEMVSEVFDPAESPDAREGLEPAYPASSVSTLASPAAAPFQPGKLPKLSLILGGEPSVPPEVCALESTGSRTPFHAEAPCESSWKGPLQSPCRGPSEGLCGGLHEGPYYGYGAVARDAAGGGPLRGGAGGMEDSQGVSSLDRNPVGGLHVSYSLHASEDCTEEAPPVIPQCVLPARTNGTAGSVSLSREDRVGGVTLSASSGDAVEKDFSELTTPRRAEMGGVLPAERSLPACARPLLQQASPRVSLPSPRSQKAAAEGPLATDTLRGHAAGDASGACACRDQFGDYRVGGGQLCGGPLEGYFQTWRDHRRSIREASDFPPSGGIPSNTRQHKAMRGGSSERGKAPTSQGSLPRTVRLQSSRRLHSHKYLVSGAQELRRGHSRHNVGAFEGVLEESNDVRAFEEGGHALGSSETTATLGGPCWGPSRNRHGWPLSAAADNAGGSNCDDQRAAHLPQLHEGLREPPEGPSGRPFAGSLLAEGRSPRGAPCDRGLPFRCSTSSSSSSSRGSQPFHALQSRLSEFMGLPVFSKMASALGAGEWLRGKSLRSQGTSFTAEPPKTSPPRSSKRALQAGAAQRGAQQERSIPRETRGPRLEEV